MPDYLQERGRMGRLTHRYEPAMTYLITTVTHRRDRVFAEARYAQVAHQDIVFYARKFKAVSLAHVVMPDHRHWVIYPSPEDFERFARAEREKDGNAQRAAAPERFYLSKIMEDYKRHTS